MSRRPDRKPISIAIVSLLAVLGLLAIQPAASADVVPGVQATDGNHSAEAYRLTDTTTGSVDSVSWKNADGRWQSSNYPVVASLDLGQLHELSSIRYFAGQIPFPATAKVSFAGSVDGSPGSFFELAAGTSPVYNKWSQPLAASGQARFIQVRFDSRDKHFNLSEVEIDATPIADPDPDPDPDLDPDPDPDPGALVDAHPATSTVDSFGEANRPNADLGPGWGAIDSYYANFPRQGNECSKTLHNRYWVLGQDGAVHPTWHPVVHSSGCSFAHDHGDKPTDSPIYDASSGVPFAMTTGFDNGGHRHEDHVGHKVVVQNNYQLVQGSTFTGTPKQVFQLVSVATGYRRSTKAALPTMR